MSNQDKSFNEPKIQLTLNIMKQDNEITYHMDNNDEIAAAHDIALLLNYMITFLIVKLKVILTN